MYLENWGALLKQQYCLQAPFQRALQLVVRILPNSLLPMPEYYVVTVIFQVALNLHLPRQYTGNFSGIQRP